MFWLSYNAALDLLTENTEASSGLQRRVEHE